MEEKTADEMFEELGYKCWEGLYQIDYMSQDNHITFNKVHHTISIYRYEDEDFISIKELQAINKKVEELGWNE